jgi:FKBP-type peptidyl-prolyl cis-trans isomerase FklB
MGTTCHAEEQVFKSPKDKINYAIGAEVARNYKNQGLELNPDMVMKGMRDALSGGKLLVPEKELRAVLIAVQSEIRRKQSSSPKPVSAESKKTGEIAK